MDREILVLRQKIHGMDAESYAAAIRERLPDHEVTLARTPEAERAGLGRVSVATGLELDPAVLEASDLELFACVYAGTSHLPLEELSDHGVAVTNAAGVHGPNVAEHAVGAVLSFARRFHVGRRRQERHVWRSYQARELKDSTVTVAGLGAIGRAIVERLEPFGCHTVGVRYTPEKGGPTNEVYGFDEFHEAVSDADYLVVVSPLTDVTEGLVDAAALRTLPADAVLVNVGRGPIVDTDALVDSLRANGIRGASLDVTDPEPLPPEHPLWEFDNVQITPHNAGHTPKYYERLADILAANVRRLEEGDADLENRVV